MHLPDRLKAYRWVRALSQKQLATVLDVDESTVWHWEQGGTQPSRENAADIEKFLQEPSSGSGDLTAACRSCFTSWAR